MIIKYLYRIISKIYNICSNKSLSKIDLPDEFVNYRINNTKNNRINNTKNNNHKLRVMSCNINELKVRNYNINELFINYNLNNYQDIGKFIKYQFLNNNIDIICLQEVWDKHVFDLITKDLTHFYIAIPSTKLKYCIGENTGLMIISKYQIYRNELYEFNNFKLYNNKIRQVYQIVDIKFNNKYYSIINTYL